MANLFEGASKLKNEAEEIEKVIGKLTLTSARLEKIEKTFSAVENISPDLEKIKEEIEAIKQEYESIDGKAISNAINDLVNRIFDNWKLWGFYVPLGIFITSFLIISYFYITSVRKVNDKIDYIYYIHLSDDKFWYNKESKDLYLGDNDWIKQKIEKEKIKMVVDK